MTTLFFVGLVVVCCVCSGFRTVYTILAYKGHPLASHRRMPLVISIVMAIFWLSWFFMVSSDPMKIKLPDWLRYTGLMLFIIGVTLFILSHTRMKGFEDKGRLLTGGIYSKIRNPMYLGFSIWLVGFPLFMEALITLVSSVIWISCIIIWKIIEEKELEVKFRDYKEYKKKTWF